MHLHQLLPIILNIILIAILLFSKTLGDELVYYLSYGVSFAGILQFFFYIFVKKFYALKLYFSFKKKTDIDGLKKYFLKNCYQVFFLLVLLQINILVGTIIASFQSSAVSYLYYADRIYQINLSYSRYCDRCRDFTSTYQNKHSI